MTNETKGAMHLAATLLRITAGAEPCDRAVTLSNALDGRVICTARIDAAAELGSKFLGDEMGIQAVADNLWADKDDQLGTGVLLVLMREGGGEPLNLIENGNSVSGLV